MAVTCDGRSPPFDVDALALLSYLMACRGLYKLQSSGGRDSHATLHRPRLGFGLC